MLRTAWRSARANSRRFTLSMVAIVLGVSFVTGSLMLTNALDRAFVSIIEGAAQDVRISPTSASGNQGPRSDRPLLSQKIVAQATTVPGVAAAAGSINAIRAYLVDADGELVGAPGPPALAINWQSDERLSTTVITRGRPPRTSGEIAVDELTFDSLGKVMGDNVLVVTPKGPRLSQLVGTFRVGDSAGLAGATLTAFTAEQAQELFAEPGAWNSVEVAVEPGSSDEAVALDLAQRFPGAEVETRVDQVTTQTQALREGLAFLTYVIVGFAIVSLLVSAFLIYNTFSMLIAQRARELALLRAVGATRTQVLGSILTEAAVVGLIAAAIGVGAGAGFARALAWLFGTFGLDITAEIRLTVPATSWGLVIGVVFTVAAAFFPARRGSRSSPMDAIRSTFAEPGSVGRIRAVSGAVLLLAALGWTWWALSIPEEPERVTRTALGVVLVVAAAITLSPLLAVSLVRLATPMLTRLAGSTGKLSARNAQRAPGRLAATSSALAVGVALVMAATVITNSARASLEEIVEGTFGAELVVGSVTGRSFDPTVVQRVRTVPGVSHAVAISGGPALLGNESGRVVAVGGGPLDAVYTLPVTQGSLGVIEAGEFVTDEELARENDWQLGTQVELTYPNRTKDTLELVGTFEGSQLLQGVLVNLDQYRALSGYDEDRTILVSIAPEADPEQVADQISTLLSDNPLLEVLDQTALKEQNAAQLGQLLSLIYALLGLSILIAALGVLNTLALAVIERTREIGMLRALGATRRQVSRMVRLEAVIISLLGTAVGIASGLIGGVALQRALVDSGIGVLDVPIPTIVAILVSAVAVGVVAALLPARRAARLNILTSIGVE